MNKKIILLLIILVGICAVSHVSAADDSGVAASDNSTDIQIIGQDDDLDNCQASDDKLGDVNLEFRKIQEDIDAAEEGGTIYLKGEYVGDYLINVNKSVNIVGTDGATIKYNSSNPLVTPFFHINNAANVNLTGITFIGGNCYWGGAITWQGDNGSITNCEFKDCFATGELASGGALLLMGDNFRISDCIFTGNHAGLYGGAILCNGTGGIISNCEFRENYVTGNKGHGGAVVLWGTDYAVVNCNFTKNHGTDWGGAISVLNEGNRIVGCNFTGNYVAGALDANNTHGGGAILSACNGLLIDNCNFTGNSAPRALGGAVSLSTNDALKNSYFNENYALYGNDISYGKNITSNTFVLDYNETQHDAILVNPDVFDSVVAANTFIKTKLNSSVEFNTGMVFLYGASGSIYVKVTGGSIDLVNITVLNHPEAKINFVNNILTVSNLGVGSYTLRAVTTPDENHTSVSGDLSITVNKATAVVTAAKVTVALKSGSSWSIKIVDSRDGKPVANMKLTLKVYTGSKYATVYLTTNANGMASYSTKGLAKGTHNVVVSGTHEGYSFNPISSSITVVKQTPITFKLYKKTDGKDGSLRTYMVMNKKTKKGINGMKIKVLIYTGKTFKTYTLKTKKVKDKKRVYMGVIGFATNDFSAGKHTVKIMPESIKYKGSVTTTIKITKSATKRPKYFRQI